MENREWNEEDDMLNKAISFAAYMHAGQLRKGTDLPYIVHPMEVLSILAAMGVSKDVMIAGVLHDTVEDTGATIEDIKATFGGRVAELVAGHTEDKSKSWEERKENAIEELKDAPYDLKCLIMADKLSNMRAIARDYREIGDKVWKRFSRPKEMQAWYYSKSIDALDGMQDNAETEMFYWELNSLYKDVFVSFLYDEKEGIIWQISVDGEAAYLRREDPEWIETKSVKLTTNAELVNRYYAERIEDNWREEFNNMR